MSTRSSRPLSASAADSATSMLAPLTIFSDVTRQQLSLMTEAAVAVLGSSEVLGKIQQQAAHQASVRRQAAAQTLRSDAEPLHMLTVQSDLLRQDLQDMAQYWAQLASAAMKTQLDMMGRMTDMLNTGSQGGFTTAIDAWRTAVAASANGAGAARAEMH